MKCLILRGLPGCGKTRFASQMQEYVICSADQFFFDRSTDNTYAFDPSLLPDAHKECRRDFRDALKKGLKVIVDNTNLSAAEIAWYYTEAEDAGYDVRIVMFDVEFDTCYTRQTKSIPLNTMVRMAAVMQQTQLPPWWRCLNG